MDMRLFLPTRWVYVWYESGRVQNVANTDILTKEEADQYKAMWEKARNEKIVRVTLETREGNMVKSFTY